MIKGTILSVGVDRSGLPSWIAVLWDDVVPGMPKDPTEPWYSDDDLEAIDPLEEIAEVRWK